jgi:hypothetical protein
VVRNGQPVQQEIAGERGPPRGLAPVRREHRLGDLADTAASSQAAGERRGGERIEVGLARQRGVERLKPLGGREQQRGSVSAPVYGERDLGAQQLSTRLLELVERSGLGHGEQFQRRVGCSGLVLALRGGQRAPSPARRLGRDLGGALQERGGRGQTPAGLRAAS